MIKKTDNNIILQFNRNQSEDTTSIVDKLVQMCTHDDVSSTWEQNSNEDESGHDTFENTGQRGQQEQMGWHTSRDKAISINCEGRVNLSSTMQFGFERLWVEVQWFYGLLALKPL